MKETKIVAIGTNKGGQSKTSTAVSLGAMDDSFYINANNLKMDNHLQTKEPYHERQNELPAHSIKRTF